MGRRKQGQAYRPETAAQAQGYLSHPLHLQNAHTVRDLAMSNLAIERKLRGCDIVDLRVRDVTHGTQLLPRAMVIQRKTQPPVQFELTEPTRVAVGVWLEKAGLRGDQ